MRHTRLISAAVGAVFLAATAAGCSQAKDAASKAADEATKKAGEVASSAAAKATEKAGEIAGDAGASAMAQAQAKAGEILGKLGTKAQQELEAKAAEAGVAIDTSAAGAEAADDPSAKIAADWFAARQVALTDGDLSVVKTISTPKVAQQAQRWVKRNKRLAGKKFQVDVVGVEAGSVDLCIGPKGKRPRTLVLKDGLVAANTKGDHTCA